MNLLFPESYSPPVDTSGRNRLNRGMVEAAELASALHSDLLKITPEREGINEQPFFVWRSLAPIGESSPAVQVTLGVGHEIFLTGDGRHEVFSGAPINILIERVELTNEAALKTDLWDEKRHGRKRSVGMVAYYYADRADLQLGDPTLAELVTGDNNRYANDPQRYLELIQADLAAIEDLIR